MVKKSTDHGDLGPEFGPGAKFAVHSECHMAHWELLYVPGEGHYLGCEECGEPAGGIVIKAPLPEGLDKIPAGSAGAMHSPCCGAHVELVYFEDGHYEIFCDKCLSSAAPVVTVTGPDLSGKKCGCCGGGCEHV